ncbi:MAG: hypothetical protein IPI54_11045 [Chitinophagaceae bacterium]|nr:hypothetical protein [Chitinophagaceae bacterium]
MKKRQPWLFTVHISYKDPVFIITHEYARLGKELPKIRGIKQKIRYLFSAPT